MPFDHFNLRSTGLRRISLDQRLGHDAVSVPILPQMPCSMPCSSQSAYLLVRPIDNNHVDPLLSEVNLRGLHVSFEQSKHDRVKNSSFWVNYSVAAIFKSYRPRFWSRDWRLVSPPPKDTSLARTWCSSCVHNLPRPSGQFVPFVASPLHCLFIQARFAT